MASDNVAPSALEIEIRRIVREELQRLQPVADTGLVPHTRWPYGSRRRCAAIARSGVIVGARRVGKLWLAPAASLEAYVDRAGEEPSPRGAGDEIDAIVARARRSR